MLTKIEEQAKRDADNYLVEEMIIKVKSYNNARNYHVCIDATGAQHFMDLVTDGSFHEETKGMNGEQCEEFLQELVGKRFRVGHCYPYIEFAGDLEEIKDDR